MDGRHRQAALAGAATSIVVAALGFLFFAPDRTPAPAPTSPPEPAFPCEDWHAVPLPSLGATSALHDVDGSIGDVWAVGSRGDDPLVLRGRGGAWELVVPDLRGVRGAVELTGVAAPTREDVWIVGVARTEAAQRPVVLRWDGQELRPARLPRSMPEDTALLAIDVADGVPIAVGGTGDTTVGTGAPVVLAGEQTRDTIRWRIERPQSETGVLRDVVVTRSGEVVAVGFRGDPVERVSIPFAEARSGRRFREYLAEERARNALYAAAAAPRGEVWALGTMAALFDGRGFRRVPVALTGTTILGVSQRSPRSAEAVGVRRTNAGPRPVFATWNGSRWLPAKVPAIAEVPGTLEAIDTARSGEGWVVGTRESAEGGVALVLRKGC